MGFLVAPWCSGFFQHHIFPRAHGHIANSITGYIAARILWQEQVTGNIPDPSFATLIFTMGIPINTLEKNRVSFPPGAPPCFQIFNFVSGSVSKTLGFRYRLEPQHIGSQTQHEIVLKIGCNRKSTTMFLAEKDLCDMIWSTHFPVLSVTKQWYCDTSLTGWGWFGNHQSTQ